MAAANILIRAREPGDAGALAEIMNCPGVVADTLRLPFGSVAEQVERMGQRRENHYGLVAELDGRVVGSLGLALETAMRRRHCAGLGMAVHDDVQGKGVGSA
jgi:putative acetyltransferase